MNITIPQDLFFQFENSLGSLPVESLSVICCKTLNDREPPEGAPEELRPAEPYRFTSLMTSEEPCET